MHLRGLKIVLSGKFDQLSQTEARARLEALGADVTGSVSSKTMVLVAGRDAGTKLAQARERGLPVIDEAQLARLLDGATLDELRGADGVPAASSAAPAVPFPEVVVRPRDGVWQQRHADGSLWIEGAYEGGLRQGSWKEHWPGGQLKNDYAWDRGLKHGPERDWTADGTQICEGRNAQHLRQGKWTWWHESNGAFAYSYEHDAAGKQHGPHLWDLEDGRPRARGQFEHGERAGDWTWWHEPGHAKMIRGYGKGRTTEDAGWFSEDQLAYRFFRDASGEKHGLEVAFHADGKPKFRGEWSHGVAVGLHTTWAEDGSASEETYAYGLPAALRADAKLAERTAKKLRKARDNYKKHDVLNEAVDYGQVGAYLVFLWKERYYDTAADPETWDRLKEARGVFSGALLMEFLATIKAESLGTGYSPPHLQYWPDELDDLVLDVYLRDPGPIDAGWRDLPRAMRKGVASCIARFGVEIGDELHGELDALAATHIEHYGLRDTIRWPAEGRTHIEERPLFDRLTGRHTPLFERYVGFFGGLAPWREKLRAAAARECAESVARLSFNQYRVLIDGATPDEMIGYIDGIALANETQDQIRDALAANGYSAEELERIALGIVDTGLRRWPALCTAVLRFAEEGRAIPQTLVERFALATESPTYSSDWYTRPLAALPEELRTDPHQIDRLVPSEPGACVPRMAAMRAALAALTPAQRLEVFERQLQAEYAKLDVCPYLYLAGDNARPLVERVLPLIEQDSYGHKEVNMYGLGELGRPVLPLLEQAAAQATKRERRDGFAQAIVVALARTLVDEGDFDAAYDRHVRFDVVEDDYYYRFLEPYLRRIVHRLPPARAERVLLDGLRGDRFHRAFRCIASHPTAVVLQTAFSELLARERSFNHEQQQAVQQGLAGLADRRAWVKWILQCGGGGGCKDALRGALGHADFEALEQELARAGVAAPKELDQVDKIVELARAAGGSGERIYLLRRQHHAPEGPALNLVYGAAPGVGADRWPRFRGEPMHHLFTLDLQTMPELGRLVDGAARTLSLFISDPGSNEAYEAGNEETALVRSTQEQLDAAPAPPADAPLDEEEQHGFEVVAVDVDPAIWFDDDGGLRREIYRAGARVLGEPIWLQGDEGDGGAFYLQFDESFVDVNLGDCGVMYVFADTAFWQCH